MGWESKKVPEKQSKARSEFIDRKENVLALGNSGAGKTHIALALGLLVSTRLAGPVQWTPVRYALLAVGGSFGFLMLVHGEWTTLIAGAVGLLGAVAAVGIARSRAARRRVPEAALAAAEPALNG